MKTLKYLAIGVVLLFASVVPMFAASTSTYLYVYGFHSTLLSVTASELNFGTFTQVSGWQLADANITVLAPVGVPYNIALNAGSYYNGNYRGISSGSNRMSYSVFQPNLASEWGDSDFDNTYHFGASVAGTGDGTSQVYTAHGMLNTSQAVGLPNSQYFDTVTITVYY